MAKNYMADVAKMLGVELGEEFKLERHNEMYKFTEEGLMYYLGDNRGWSTAPFTLNDTLSGKYSVIKLPWKPKNCKNFWYIGWRKGREKWKMVAYKLLHSEESPYSNLFVDSGNCFRTKEEAIAARFDIFKRLTGKNWHKTYGKEGDDGNV